MIEIPLHLEVHLYHPVRIAQQGDGQPQRQILGLIALDLLAQLQLLDGDVVVPLQPVALQFVVQFHGELPLVDGITGIGARIGGKGGELQIVESDRDVEDRVGHQQVGTAANGHRCIAIHLAVEGEIGALPRNIADMATLAAQRGDIGHKILTQTAVGKAQVALLGAQLINGETKVGSLAACRRLSTFGCRRLRQQLLQVGGAIFVDLDAGEGLVQGNVLDPHLLADAVVRQTGESQGVELQQPLIVCPIDHLEPVDIEPPLQGQLAEISLGGGGEIKAGLAAQQPVLHLDAYQIGQIGLCQCQGQPLLVDVAA